MSDQKNSDYGEIFLYLCDDHLRQNVVNTLITARTAKAEIKDDQLNEIAAYINQLEDALVRHHSGMLNNMDVADYLKRCTGLDLSALAFTVDSMQAEDA